MQETAATLSKYRAGKAHNTHNNSDQTKLAHHSLLELFAKRTLPMVARLGKLVVKCLTQPGLIAEGRAMIDPAACPICESHDHTLFAQKETLIVVTCQGCGFIFLAPLPQPDDSVALYDDAYSGTTEGYFAKVEKKMRRSRGRARRLRRLTNGTAPRLLDVGASGGFMVQAAREVGFDAQGLELDPKSVAFARARYPGNDFFHGTIENYLETYPHAASAFDVIYCAEVIEHVPDVNNFVAAIAQVMKPDGRLYLTTPDIGHWRRPKNIAQWDAFDPPAHCLYFDRASLRRLLAKHGLQILSRDLALKPGLKVLVGKI